MIRKAPRKTATKKPSSQKRTGKAVAKKDASKYLGGAAGKAADAIKKATARRRKALKELG